MYVCVCVCVCNRVMARLLALPPKNKDIRIINYASKQIERERQNGEWASEREKEIERGGGGGNWLGAIRIVFRMPVACFWTLDWFFFAGIYIVIFCLNCTITN